MSRSLPIRPARIIAALAVSMACYVSAATAQQSLPPLKGRSLQEALRILQHEGLRIVFSSEAVTADMRVREEPRARSRRAQLDELLEPHGLKAVSGPGPIIQIVAKRNASSRAMTSSGSAPSVAPPAGNATVPQTYSEAVLVRAGEEASAGSSVAVDVNRLQESRGTVDDVLQAIQALPRVASVDDYRGEFSVRGSPYRHVGSVIDGVATPWLRHSVYGRSDLGSLSMFSSEGLQSATLHTGAYPQRYGDRLGAELEMTLREGSRESRQFHGSIGGTALAVAGEGPLGEAGRGSWIVSLRNSYLDWPVKRPTVGGSSFAFADAHAKLVYDVSPSQQLTFTALGGRSRLDSPDDVAPSALAVGTNDAILFSLGWRTSLGARGVVRQSVAVIDQRLSNALQAGQSAGGAHNHEIAYHVDVRHTLAGGRIEGGAGLSRLDGVRDLRLDRGIVPTDVGGPVDATFAAQWWARSAYVHFDRVVCRTFSVGGGVRVASSTLVQDSIVSPWLLTQWRFRPNWAIDASIGVAHQFPDFDFVGSTDHMMSLRPERATHLDIGLERRLAGSYRWQATFFNRIERDVLGLSRTGRLLGGGSVTAPGVLEDYQNALAGRSRGIELILAREGRTRLTGWISYAYGRTSQTDTVTNETFWADFDRRHAFSAVAIYRVSPVATVEVDFRASTNVPIAGHLTDRDGMLFVGTRRNDVRLPNYARLDARAQRTFGSGGRRVGVFGEMLNLFNRQNLGPAEGVIDAQTGRALGFTRELMPRRVSVGVAIHF
jgi:hypothetical protein